MKIVVDYDISFYYSIFFLLFQFCYDVFVMNSRDFAGLLLDSGAVKLSFNPPFTYTSGMKAPIYTDNRLLIGHPEAYKKVVSGFVDLARGHDLKFDWLAGTATAGIPWAAFLAYSLGLPMVYVRSQAKGHGAGKQVEGFLASGKRVLVVEDLVTTGGSSLNTVSVLQREGESDVVGVAAIFTYGFDSTYEAFEKAGIRLFTLTDFDVLLAVARETGRISSEDFEKILDYKKDPAGWAARMGM